MQGRSFKRDRKMAVSPLGSLLDFTSGGGVRVNHPISKSVLSERQSKLVEILQRLNFGRIEGLQVRNGAPVFEPAPRVIRKLKMGSDNAPRPEAALEDFWLQRPTVEMLQAIADLGDGEVLAIEVKHGLPFTMELEQPG